MKTLKFRYSRPLYWGLVLILVGLVALVIQVSAAWSAELTLLGTGMSEAGTFAGSEIHSSARTKQYDDKVLFRYLDEDFTSVAVAGSFNEWRPVEMELDPKSGAWFVTVTMERGRHSYQFLVEESDQKWEAIDPSNARARKDAEHGWVSLISVPRKNLKSEMNPEEDEESGPTKALVDIDFNLERDRFSDRDDKDVWESHRRRYVRRELKLMYSQPGKNASFQRVDGFSVFITPSSTSQEDFGPALKGLFSYGFRSKEWTLGGTLVQPLLENRRLMALISGYSGTDFQDNTGIGCFENSLAGAFFREDFRDYYKREGITLSFVAYPASSMRLELGYESSDYTSLETLETWSFSGGEFADNPAIDEGTLRSYFAKARIGTRNNNIVAHWESGRNKENDPFDYSLMKTAYRGRLSLSKSRYLDFRTVYATALSGELPIQRRFPAGGLGTVRGYYYQSLLTPDPSRAISSVAKGGQRMLVANFEYAFSFNTDVTWDSSRWDDDWEGFDGFEHFDIDSAFFFFFDTGMAWEDRSADFDLSDLKSSAGIGFQFDDNGPRLDLIKTMDDGGHDTLLQIRLERMF
ncbi:MAG: BamA/TamA family outer membrane protein [Gemmatimonadales bacterium]|nr:BamA/TamA family outer membrane protein [Gemmatimonadales bacterium]